ncbi:hypothetical protein PQR46_20265 [Paraburkholderia sediminicola]|uniref:hypothetical protein n=1 Tax=Paraburkholderia TaxID=1822464 RepID=UPI0038BB46A2
MFTHRLVPTDGSALSEAVIQIAVTFGVEDCAKVAGRYVIPVFMSRECERVEGLARIACR